jgi:integral membrane protein
VLQTAIGRVRLVGLLEGVSFLVLLGIAMPLKYFAHRPDAVFVVGWAHGLLFVLYAAVTFAAWGAGAITFRAVAFAALAALLPGGPFVLDGYLRRLEQRKGEPS